MFMWFFFLSPPLECSEMNKTQPIFDPATGYRIEVRGRIDVEWLQDFDSSTEIINEEMAQVKDMTIIHIHSDQSGVVGLIRRIHGLGLTILKVELLTRKEE
jgi:hypothetical protein